MGCWINKDEPCCKCFGCYSVEPGLISTKMKLLNGTAITSIVVFEGDS